MKSKLNKNTDIERIFIATSDGKSIYHQLSIIQSSDGSFCCNLGSKPNPKDTHLTYHKSGQVNWHFWNTKEVHSLVAPKDISKIFNFPGEIAHINTLGKKVTYNDLRKFNPSKVVFIDLTKYKKSSISIHTFLLPPSLLDYIKLPFILGSNVSQVQIVTDTNPWIGIEVVENNTMAEGPAFMSDTSRASLEGINKLYLDVYYDGKKIKKVRDKKSNVSIKVEVSNKLLKRGQK